MKTITKIKACIAVTALLSSTALSAQDYQAVNFEESQASDWESNMSFPIEITDLMPRSGAKGLVVSYDTYNGSANHIVNTAAPVTVSGSENVHVIAYMASDNIGANATLTMSKPGDMDGQYTPSFGSFDVEDTYQRFNWTKATGAGTIYPKLRIKLSSSAPSTFANFYVDDVFIYVSDQSIDLVKPEAATSLSVNAKQLDWTQGVDNETGVQSTVVLRSANLSAANPELLNQVSYAVSSTDGITTVGDWSVIAVVGASDVSYLDNTAVDGTAYAYAIVHRDLAFNYSDALVKSTPTSINAISNSKALKAYPNPSATGIFTIEDITTWTVYNSAGSIVLTGEGEKIDLSNYSKGVYILKSDTSVVKLIVK